MAEQQITIAALIGQRVIATSPQTGRRFSGTVIGQAFITERSWAGAAWSYEPTPIAIVQLDQAGPLMRVFLHSIQPEETP